MGMCSWKHLGIWAVFSVMIFRITDKTSITRLVQFQRNIQDSIAKSVGEEIKTEMKKINRRSDDNGPRQNRIPFTAGRDCWGLTLGRQSQPGLV
jgi:hypothetical protein